MDINALELINTLYLYTRCGAVDYVYVPKIYGCKQHDQ